MHFDRLKKIEIVRVAGVQAAELSHRGLFSVLKGRCTRPLFVRDDLSEDIEGESDV